MHALAGTTCPEDLAAGNDAREDFYLPDRLGEIRRLGFTRPQGGTISHSDAK